MHACDDPLEGEVEVSAVSGTRPAIAKSQLATCRKSKSTLWLEPHLTALCTCNLTTFDTATIAVANMFARGLVACSKRAAVSEPRVIARCGKFPRRRYSSSAPEAHVPGADSTSAVAALGGLNSELDKLTPRFNVDAKQIQIIKTPTEFYETLKVGFRNNNQYQISILAAQ